jgi:LysM repeat protein
MKFNNLSNELINQHQVEEKINWKGLLAAGLLSLPGMGKEPTAPAQMAAGLNFPLPKFYTSSDTSSAEVTRPSKEEYLKAAIKSRIRKREGSNDYNRIKALHGGPSDPTIGWGHSLRYRNSSKAIFAQLFPKFKFENIFDEKNPAELSPEQAEKLLEYDFKIRFNNLKKWFPNLMSLEDSTIKSLFDLHYRGDLIKPVRENLKSGKKDEAIKILRNNVSGTKDSIKNRVENNVQELINSEFFGKSKEKDENKVSAKIKKNTAIKKPAVAAPVQAPAPAVKKAPQVYNSIEIVRAGDTLSKIINNFNKKNNTKVTLKDVMKENPSLNPSLIKPGQQIKFSVEK